MKRIHILESQSILFESDENQAGTDFPHFYDEKTDTYYEASWDGMYAFPFGYWPLDYYGSQMEFSVGDEWTTHETACGKVAKKYFAECMKERFTEDGDFLEEFLSDLVREMEEYGYSYNEETDMYVSEDGSDEFDIDQKVSEAMDNVYSIPQSDVEEYVKSAVEDLEYPTSYDIVDEQLEGIVGEYDFTDRRGIDYAMKEIGSSFETYFEMGRNEGRIWPSDELITFYESEQPDPRTFVEILRQLENSDEIGLTYEKMLNFIIIFEDWNNDGVVTACTVSDYINGNYGESDDEDDEEEDDSERQYARQEKTKFVPHLANQQQKREFFKDFRDTRDRAIYTPMEKGANTIAQYHAMRYPYGENIERNPKKIKL